MMFLRCSLAICCLLREKSTPESFYDLYRHNLRRKTICVSFSRRLSM